MNLTRGLKWQESHMKTLAVACERMTVISSERICKIKVPCHAGCCHSYTQTLLQWHLHALVISLELCLLVRFELLGGKFLSLLRPRCAFVSLNETDTVAFEFLCQNIFKSASIFHNVSSLQTSYLRDNSDLGRRTLEKCMVMPLLFLLQRQYCAPDFSLRRCVHLNLEWQICCDFAGLPFITET